MGLARTPGAGDSGDGPHDRARAILREALIAERDAVLRLRNTGQISDAVAEELETELNLDLLRLGRVLRRPIES